jgi:hypothetical protein
MVLGVLTVVAGLLGPSGDGRPGPHGPTDQASASPAQLH